MLAATDQRQAIYAVRHSVYGLELGQHVPNSKGQLTDSLDDFNAYLVAEQAGKILAFVSITPPGRTYSIDKYFHRKDVPLRFDGSLFEVRLLTVLADHRRTLLAAAMMYAACRYIESHGGDKVVAIGRREIIDFYLRVGLQKAGLQAKSGAVTYDLLVAAISDLRQSLERFQKMLERIEASYTWDLPFAFRSAAPRCEHGGAFWAALGDHPCQLEKLHETVNADVLDAWFPPAPEVLTALRSELSTLVSTSPPAHASGLVRCISRARGIPANAILPAAGSSELIYLAFPRWLTAGSRVLVVDPSYGEYEHLLRRVIGCTVKTLPLHREENYVLDTAAVAAQLSTGFDLVVLVNPNSPTGTMIRGESLEQLARGISSTARLWIDETYIDYAGAVHSLERLAATSKNVFVCKSMSKAYALSGVRVAYLVGNCTELEKLCAFVPPWSVSLPAQVAAVMALESSEYYSARYAETAQLRDEFAADLRCRIGLNVVPGVANFLLCHMPDHFPTAAEICNRCREKGVFLRDAGTISRSLGDRALRIAVKNKTQNDTIVNTLAAVLGCKIAA
jgi:histidinol-phosphate/aromatic aminotransferase/cobyric acid decarboxylase-like protein